MFLRSRLTLVMIANQRPGRKVFSGFFRRTLHTMQAMGFERRPRHFWSPAGRAIVFILACTSIACLLSEFYRFCPMRAFTLFVFLPALTGLAALMVADLVWGDRQLWRGAMIGIVSGLTAAVAYDLFRLPFVCARVWGIDSIVPPLNLFKVFPAFGAMILGEPTAQTDYSFSAYWVGWIYHFSNGMTFGVMFVAWLGEIAKKRWIWGMAMAVGLELGMLLTPYPNVFGIPITAAFVGVTLAAHLLFGATMGLTARRLTSTSRPRQTAVG